MDKADFLQKTRANTERLVGPLRASQPHVADVIVQAFTEMAMLINGDDPTPVAVVNGAAEPEPDLEPAAAAVPEDEDAVDRTGLTEGI